MKSADHLSQEDLTKVYDQLYSGKRYDIGAIGTLYYWMKETLVGESIVDLCCGRGVFGNYIKKMNYLGVDFSNVVVEQNRLKWPNRRYEVADLTKTQTFGKFDNVVLCDAMEHFRERDLSIVLDNVRNCCHATSKIYMLISTRPSSGHRYGGETLDLHLLIWSPDQWLSRLRDYRFDILRHKEDVTTSTLLVECKPL